MWTCPKCNEALEDEFDSCWRCAGAADQSGPFADAKPSPARLLTFPFKVYIVLAYPLLKLVGLIGWSPDDYHTMYSLFAVPVKYNTAAVTGVISAGYAASVLALLLACGSKRQRVGALVFAGVGLFLFMMLYPWGTQLQ